MDAFTNIPSNGKFAMKFDEDSEDRLIGVALLEAGDDVLLATREGRAIRFDGEDVREFVSRTSTGVRGMRLRADDEVVSLSILHRVGTQQEEREQYLRFAPWKAEKDGVPELSDERFDELAAKEQFILTVCANGFGKVSSSYEYRRIGRGGQGVTNIDNIERNGPVVASFPVQDGQQLMLVTDQAKLIRMPMDLRHLQPDPENAPRAFRIIGRGSAGLKLFDVAKGETIVSAVLIDEQAEPENEAEEMIAEELAGRDAEATEPYTTPQSDDDIRRRARRGMRIEPSGEVCGAEVFGVDLSGPLDEDTVAQIRSAWLAHRVLAFPDQYIDDDALERFTLAMGGFGEDPFFAPIEGRRAHRRNPARSGRNHAAVRRELA